jgi:hypothetical protein
VAASANERPSSVRHDAAGMALEQLDAQRRLEPPDMVADDAGGEPQLLGSFGKIDASLRR